MVAPSEQGREVCGVTSRWGCEGYIQSMTLISPWHSIRQSDRNVYHDNDLCPTGQAIESKYRKNGRRCRLRCSTCAKLAGPEAVAARLALLLPL